MWTTQRAPRHGSESPPMREGTSHHAAPVAVASRFPPTPPTPRFSLGRPPLPFLSLRRRLCPLLLLRRGWRGRLRRLVRRGGGGVVDHGARVTPVYTPPPSRAAVAAAVPVVDAIALSSTRPIARNHPFARRKKATPAVERLQPRQKRRKKRNRTAEKIHIVGVRPAWACEGRRRRRRRERSRLRRPPSTPRVPLPPPTSHRAGCPVRSPPNWPSCGKTAPRSRR